jgi:hypothetical protein
VRNPRFRSWSAEVLTPSTFFVPFTCRERIPAPCPLTGSDQRQTVRGPAVPAPVGLTFLRVRGPSPAS